MKYKFDYHQIISNLYDYFKGEKNEIILNNFCNELLITGWSVCKAAKDYGVTPHIMNNRMIKLYTESDAFIYECVVGSLEPEKIKKDKFISDYMKNKIPDDQLEVLCYGDGIGSDSQTHAVNGHSVTYFDFEGPSSEFAKYCINKIKLIDKIKFIYNELKLEYNNYDVVICREVLEHLENPINTMRNLRGYLKKDGICFLSESFSRVEKKFPTHLSSNLKYVGKTIEIMVKIGFRYFDRFEDSNLLVFKKVEMNDECRFETIPQVLLKKRLKKRLKDMLMYYLS